jgi:hypothetical protein
MSEYQLAQQRPQLVGQVAGHASHQRVQPPATRGEPFDEVAVGAAHLDHAVESIY